MAKDKAVHLDEERIILSVMDESGQDESTRRHLVDCADCRAEKESLQGRLARFGQISREAVPIPRRQPRLLARESRAFKPVWKIRPALGMGLALASVLAILISPLHFKHSRTYTLEKVYQEMIQDDKFMTEIEMLEENPLPRFYVDISDPNDGIDDTEERSPGGAG